MLFGTSQEGFEISADWNTKQVSLRAWGFWSAATAASLQTQLRLLISGFAGSPWSMLADFTDYKTQAPEVYATLQEAFKGAGQNGMKRVAAVTRDAISRLQIWRLSAQTVQAVWTFHATALEAKVALTGGK